MENLKYILESLLFVSSTPLSMDRLKRAVPEVDTKAIKDALEALGQEYETRGGGFLLHHVAGGYQLRTRPDFAQWIKRLHQSRPVRLSKPALETLAIIAYRQPALRSDIEYIRGVDCGGVLKLLMEKQLVRVLGRDKEKAGRPMIYATTKRFLEIFDLKDLSELPTLKEIEELGLTTGQNDEGSGEHQLLDEAADSLHEPEEFTVDKDRFFEETNDNNGAQVVEKDEQVIEDEEQVIEKNGQIIEDNGQVVEENE